MKLLAAIFPLLVLPLDAAAGGCPAAPAKIEKAIRRHIVALRAAEYCEARTVKTEDGVTVAIYTAEGACAGQDSRAAPGTCSNNWVRYMVALSGQQITPPVAVGGKGDLTDTSVKISERAIEVSGFSLGPNDSMCCPSVPTAKKFRIAGAALKEVSTVTAKRNSAAHGISRKDLRF